MGAKSLGVKAGQTDRQTDRQTDIQDWHASGAARNPSSEPVEQILGFFQKDLKKLPKRDHYQEKQCKKRWRNVFNKCLQI